MAVPLRTISTDMLCRENSHSTSAILHLKEDMLCFGIAISNLEPKLHSGEIDNRTKVYKIVCMSNSTTMSFKIDKAVKERAKSTAESIGIPLSTVITIFLKDFAATGRLEVTAAEDMTPQTERIIEKFREEIAHGNVSPVFSSAKEAEKYLRSL